MSSYSVHVCISHCVLKIVVVRGRITVTTTFQVPLVKGNKSIFTIITNKKNLNASLNIKNNSSIFIRGAGGGRMSKRLVVSRVMLCIGSTMY